MSDSRRYSGRWWKSKGFWTSLAYRVTRARKTGAVACQLLWPLDVLTKIAKRIASDAELPWTADIGPGLFLPHPQGVVVAERVRLGPKVSLYQQVTLGAWEGGVPVVHGHAAVFAGAKVIGGVCVGRWASVGANAVVVKDVPCRHTAVGVPAATWPSTHNRGCDVRLKPHV